MKKLQDLSPDLTTKLNQAEQEYKYQPQLTEKLDTHSGEFTETTPFWPRKCSL